MCSWYLHLAAWRRRLKDGTGQVTLVLAATGSGGRTVWVGVLPLLEEFFGLVEEDSLLSRLADVAVGFEERADVQGLAAPEVTVDGPVEGQLE